jgi:hypothetical protein
MTTSTKTNATTATKMIIPSFDKSARALITAKKLEHTATEKFNTTCKRVIQAFIDSCVVAGMQRNVKASKALQNAMQNNALMTEAAKTPTGVNQKTFNGYALNAAKAFYFDQPWSTTLGQNPDFKIPSKDGGEVKQYPAKTKKELGANPKKTGTVKQTNKKALIETLEKAMEQCTILNHDSIRAGILDLCIEINPKFKVTQ